jgi:putative phosphoesterase
LLIGIISDTHGLTRPEALHALAGVELIIHAGDVGSPKVLEALAEIAPVQAIRGNVDTEPWAQVLPETREVPVGAARFYVIHNVADMTIDPAGFDAVISGHSHRANVELRNGVLYLNPGSAGPRRFRLPVTLMTALVDGRDIRASVALVG